MRASIEYRGSAALVGLLAQMLRDEGLEARYEAPYENRSVGGEAVVIVVSVISGRVLDPLFGPTIDRAIERFRQRMPGAPLTVTFEDTPANRPGDQ